jgi:hypothetical protein
VIRPTAIALSLCLLISSVPKAQAQGVLVIPEAAAIIIIGGIAYYVWTNSEGLREQVAVPSSSMPIEDPEDEMERMGQAQQVESVTAGTQQRAEGLCRGLAQTRGLTMKEVKHFRDNQWNCVMY